MTQVRPSSWRRTGLPCWLLWIIDTQVTIIRGGYLQQALPQQPPPCSQLTRILVHLSLLLAEWFYHSPPPQLKRAVFRIPTTLASGQFKSLHFCHDKYTIYYTCYVCANRVVSGGGGAGAAGRLVVGEKKEGRCCTGLVTQLTWSHETTLNLP